jgi:hypothetical protein
LVELPLLRTTCPAAHVTAKMFPNLAGRQRLEPNTQIQRLHSYHYPESALLPLDDVPEGSLTLKKEAVRNKVLLLLLLENGVLDSEPILYNGGLLSISFASCLLLDIHKADIPYCGPSHGCQLTCQAVLLEEQLAITASSGTV